MAVAIEGYPKLICEDNPTQTLAAWSGTDWTSALGGLFVELQNRQRIDPYDPFTPGGRCVLTVIDTDGTDRFGIDVYRRSAGIETVLTASVDRDDTAISVASSAGFTAGSDMYIGTECMEVVSTAAGTVNVTKRGKYSPFRSGNTSTRFANHHRVAYDHNHVLLNPIVSQQPRVWLGRRVGVWMHTVAADGTLNSKDDALLVYAGVIVGVSDDPRSLGTKIELKHILDVVQDSTLGRDIYGAEIPEGLYLQTGRVFNFKDGAHSTAWNSANALTVVASGASGANQVNAGTYTAEQICNILNQWLGSEKDAGRIIGLHSWGYAIPTSNGLRTKNHWRITYASNEACGWIFSLPGEVSAFLGFREFKGDERGQTVAVHDEGRTNNTEIFDGDAVPFTTLVFKPAGPAIAQEFSEALVYPTQNERGTFVDQLASLPANIVAVTDSNIGYQWGVFLLDEKQLIVASYDSAAHTITNAWLAPWRITGQDDTAALKYIGRRLDESEQGPVTLRQVFVLTGTLQNILKRLFYGSGTTNYNSATYDSYGIGLGIGIPGELLGTQFDNSIDSLPSSQSEIVVIFDEATKLPDVLASDLLLRRASLRWYNEHLEFKQWQTPAGGLSVATLTDANKAAPAGNSEDHRSPTLESTVFQRPIVKIDYDLDFATNRDAKARKSIQLEDWVPIDDGGGETKPLTIKARNTFSDFAGTGAAIEELTKGYLATMPQFSRSARHLRRSIDHRYWEVLGVGDVVTVTDTFARDPATGLRGINSRYGTVVELTYDPGGPSPDGTIRQMTGEVEIRFPDVNRHLPYGPSARVDDTAPTGGYVSATKTLTCYAHQYSEASEAADATNFPAGYKVRVEQIDPDDPAVYLSWDDTVASQTGNTIVLTTGLAGWDSTKRYRVVFDDYADGVTAQHDFAYEADYVDQLVQDVEAAYQYSSTPDNLIPTPNTGTDKAIFHSSVMDGDGKSRDAGTDADLANTINMFIDRKSAHQNPFFAAVDPGSAAIGVNTNTGGWSACWFTPIFCGTDRLGVGVMRYLTLAPMAKMPGAGTGSIRVTLSRSFPQVGSGYSASVGGSGLANTRFGDIVSQKTWTVSSTTLSTLTDQSMKLNVKGLMTGIIWLTVEIKDSAGFYGFGKYIEGPRTLL
jgi:hypothetical protein